MKGGVHICELANGNLTWEKLSLPKPVPLWYTMRIGLNTYISTLEGPVSISCGQYLDPTLGKFPPIYGLRLP